MVIPTRVSCACVCVYQSHEIMTATHEANPFLAASLKQPCMIGHAQDGSFLTAPPHDAARRTDRSFLPCPLYDNDTTNRMSHFFLMTTSRTGREILLTISHCIPFWCFDDHARAPRTDPRRSRRPCARMRVCWWRTPPGETRISRSWRRESARWTSSRSPPRRRLPSATPTVWSAGEALRSMSRCASSRCSRRWINVLFFL